MCRVVGGESTCAVLTVVVGSVLAVLHLVCSSCAAPASHGDVCFGVGPNGTTHDAFCSAVHHLMCCFSTHYGRPSGNGLLGALAARFR